MELDADAEFVYDYAIKGEEMVAAQVPQRQQTSIGTNTSNKVYFKSLQIFRSLFYKLHTTYTI